MGFQIKNGVLKKYIEEPGITAVVIPDSVTSIGDGAFSYCSSLTSITIPDSVTSIGDSAFRECSSLISITIPDSVTSFGDSAFFGCSSLTSIIIPDSVTSIGNHAFEECSSLTSITIPDSVTSIGDCAFAWCSSLTSITIPDSVTSIGRDAFFACKNLTSITIPDSVTSIGNRAFAWCSSLTSITIPDSVTSIGNEAFYFCKSLSSITIPGSVTNIDGNVFFETDNLKEILVKKNNNRYTSENGVLFTKDKKKLVCCPSGKKGTIIIPDGVTSIGKDAFNNCSNLTSITIPESVTSIDGWAFYNCGNLTNITVPDNVIRIGKGAFQACSRLTSITVPDSVNSIGEDVFLGCESLTSITIPDSVTSIGRSTFFGCSSLTSITIPDSVTSIGRRAFWRCSSLTSITIPESVTSIDKDAFEECHLSEVQISFETLIKTKSPELWEGAVESMTSAELANALKKCPKRVIPGVEKRIIKSDDIFVIRYFEKANKLEEYAAFHNTDADTLRDSILSDFGLDESGNKTWTLADKTYRAHLENNLSITLSDESGKILKSLPKKGADPAEYDAAKKELAALKKNIKAAAKLRNNRLLADFLTARPRPAEAWKGTYLKNPLLRQLAKLVVWQQGSMTFTLDASGNPVDAAGDPVSLKKGKILLAHPMEMGEEATKAWQGYFISHQLAQPFAQVWEPVLDGIKITPDRYKGATIPLHMLMNKALHGITMEGQSQLKLQDCSADLKLIEGHHDWYKNKFEITNFRFKKYTRAVNHIAAHFDKGTVESRLLKDDVSAVQWLDYFTQAQITEFINLVTEQGDCPNATAALLAYKQEKYPDTDAFADFVLEW